MCGDSECAVSDLSDHVEMLNQITEGSTLLEKEFKVCTSFPSCALIRVTSREKSVHLYIITISHY